jgi:hypothetical protein
MDFIKTCYVAIAIAGIHTLSGCQQPQKTPASVQPQPTAATHDKSCSGQASSPDPWVYNQHSEWELPGITVPEIYAAAKKVLLEDWKMPDSSNRSENQGVDYLSASVRVTSALDTSFELSIVKLNEKSCRLTIDAKSKRIPPAQLEEHCSLMYDNISKYLDTSPQNKHNKKELWNGNQKMYVVGDYKFDYPVKNVFDAAAALLEQMHVSIYNPKYDDFAAMLWFTSGNNCEMAIDLQMTDESKCLLTFFSRNKQDNVIEKWGEIFIQRLHHKLAEPQPAAASSITPESKPAKNIYYGQNSRPSSLTKTVEHSYAVEKIDIALKRTLVELNIGVPAQTPRDALTAKFNFKTANSADWWVTISQTTPDQSKVLFSATNIWSEDFEKYTAAIIKNLEKQLQQPEKSDTLPAAVKTENK